MVLPVLAHGFGRGYDLPLPLWLYLYGAAAAVALSFVPPAVLSGRKGRDPRRYATFDLFRVRGLGALLHSRLLFAGLRFLSVGLFGLVVAAGLFGSQGGGNLAPAFVWAAWWVGFAVFVAFVGNPWPLVSPWAVLFGWADGGARRLGRREGLWLGWEYPEALGVWPAVALYAAFVWFENVFADPGLPRNVALSALLYSLVTLYGMACFGREVWLRHGEAFAVLFGLLARFAPTEVGERGLNLRPPAVGLTAPGRTPPGGVAFVALVLAGITYDGLLETPLWVEVVRTTPITQTGGLFLVWAVFAGAYLGCAKLGRVLGGETASSGRSAAAQVYALVPIAVAYQIAHYGTFLIVQGQALVALASDPFGWGWDLFGTAGFRPDYGLLGVGAVWYGQVGLVVAGHVVAVWLSHRVSASLQGGSRRVVLGQVPMLVFMVLYTVSGLWILAQPIVG